MDLNKHIAKNDDNKPFHSNGYARVANGDRLGSTDKVSFNQRQQINYNRQFIGGYNSSAIGSSYINSSHCIKSTERGTISGSNMYQRLPLQQHNSLNVGPRRFNEPSSRKYNPYS